MTSVAVVLAAKDIMEASAMEDDEKRERVLRSLDPTELRTLEQYMAEAYRALRARMDTVGVQPAIRLTFSDQPRRVYEL